MTELNPLSFSELLEHYQMNHVEWGVFWNSITVQAISRRCSGIGWTPISLRAPCHGVLAENLNLSHTPSAHCSVMVNL